MCMKRYVLLIIAIAIVCRLSAQTCVKRAIDEILTNPDWMVKLTNSTENYPDDSLAVKSRNTEYQLAITDTTAVLRLLDAFAIDKDSSYSYMRTSAEYNQATQSRYHQRIVLQNKVRLEAHSTEYSLVSLAMVDPECRTHRTHYIFQWYPQSDGIIRANLYVLYGPRLNH